MTLLAYYKLNDSGLDSGPSGLDGVETNMSYVTGKVGNSADFNGTSSKIVIGALNVGNTYSISFWFKSDIIENYRNIFDTDFQNGNAEIRLETNSSNQLRLLIANGLGGIESVYASYNIQNNIWYHIVYTFDVTNLLVNAYLNGVQTVTDQSITQLPSSFTNLGIGGGFSIDANRWYNGKLDELRFYDTILTQSEITTLYKYNPVTEIEIEGIDYSNNIFDWKTNDESIYRVGDATVNFIDTNNTIGDLIKRYQEIKLWHNSVLIFTNVIINIDDGTHNSQILDIYSQDYWFFFLRAPHTKSYTNKTASYILNDMVTTNQDLKTVGLSVSGIVTTTNLYSFDFYGKACSDIAIQLALLEDFTVYVDKTKNVIFKSNIASDSGVHLVYADNGMRSEDFKRTGLGMVNVCRVRGTPGSPPNTSAVAAIYEDEYLINKFKTNTFSGRIPMQEINAPELTTAQQCRDRAEYEVKKRNEEPRRAIIKIDLNSSLSIGELITLTISHKNITAETFYMQSVGHNYTKNETTLKVLYYTRTNADMVQAILEKSITSSQYLSDTSVVFSKFKTLTENLIITSYLNIDRRSYVGAEYGEFDYSDKYYGQVSGGWTSEVADKQTIVTNDMFETIIRIIGQIATVPTKMDGANSNIAIGSGATAINVSDTILENELYREGMEAGYPNKTADSEISFQSIIGDGTVITTTIYNLGIFNDASAGEYQSGVVLDTVVNKASDEEIKITWKFKFNGTYLTTNGKNLIRDLYSGHSLDFLDNSNSSIEITTTTPSTYREGMEATHPQFTTATKDAIRYQIDVSGADVLGAGIDGETYTEMDLYNKTSSGIKVVDGSVVSTEFSSLEDLVAQIILKLGRGI